MLQVNNPLRLSKGITMTNTQSQIDLTGEQLRDLAINGAVAVTRKIGAYRITFNIALDEERHAVCVGAGVGTENLPLVGFPQDRAHNFIVPVFKSKKD